MRAGLRDGVLQAVSVHHSPIDREEQMLPLDQRSPGVAGYQAVLPALWQALVVADGWQPSELWQALSWGPSAFLAQEPEVLQPGTQRWLLFDPEQPINRAPAAWPLMHPCQPRGLQGQLLASGLLRLSSGRWIRADQGAHAVQRPKTEESAANDLVVRHEMGARPEASIPAVGAVVAEHQNRLGGTTARKGRQPWPLPVGQ